MVTPSKVKGGTLTLGGLLFSCLPTTIALEFDYDQDDATEVLCGDSVAGTITESASLTFTALQDFDDPDGLTAWSWTNAMTEQPFIWAPNATGTSYAGTVSVRRLNVGGDVGALIDADATWTIVGDITPTYPAAAVPTIAAISPVTGPTGTAVTISGTNFITDDDVAAKSKKARSKALAATSATATVGGVALDTLVVAGDGLITGTVATSVASGAQDVVVTTSAGTATLTGGFTVTE